MATHVANTIKCLAIMVYYWVIIVYCWNSVVNPMITYAGSESHCSRIASNTSHWDTAPRLSHGKLPFHKRHRVLARTSKKQAQALEEAFCTRTP